MSAKATRHAAGILDTNVIILWDRIDRSALPASVAISVVTIAELAAGVHTACDVGERARRLETLQRAEAAFNPIPFDVAAARTFGLAFAYTVATGREPRRRVADLMIAAIAGTNDLALYTTNPCDFRGLERVVEVIAVPHPG